MTRPPRIAAAAPGSIDESAQELYDHAPCGYVTTLPDGSIVRINQTLLDWIGFTREQLVGHRRFQDLLSTPGRIYHETHFSPLLRMQGFANEIAFDLIRPDGSSVPVLVNGACKLDDDGEPAIHRIMVFNASSRRTYERELLEARRIAEQAARSKTELLSMISHDVRTPLSSIMLALQMLEEGTRTPSQQRMLDVIRGSADDLLDLTRQLLAASRIESGTLALEERSFEVRELLQRQLSNIEDRARRKELVLEMRVSEKVPIHVYGDPVKIGQVLANLLGNALKFTDSGSIILTVELAEICSGIATIAFSVSDTGIGIPKDQLDLIFDAFTQGDYDVGLRYGGTGLGLNICRRLLALHGAKMMLESEPDRGSTFSFSLRLRMIA